MFCSVNNVSYVFTMKIKKKSGYQTLIMNDKITLYNSYTTWLST